MFRSKFLVSFLIVLLAILLQFRFVRSAGWSPDFVLAVLITLVFQLGFWELLFLSLLSIWLLNWQPLLDTEILLLALIPLLVFLLKKFLPWQTWLNDLVSVVGGLLIFYFFSSYPLFLENVNVFIVSIAAGLAFSLIVSQTFIYFYKYR